nr:MAG TPA: hypothetical protein [Caudoviricetes sp.]
MYEVNKVFRLCQKTLETGIQIKTFSLLSIHLYCIYLVR